MKLYLRRTLVQQTAIQQGSQIATRLIHLKFKSWVPNKNVPVIIILLTIIIAIASCKESYSTYENSMGINPALLAQIDTPNYTIIRWKDSVQNFGSITAGDSVKVHFNFENAGKKALFILEVQPSCGCTDVAYPRGIILPGASGVVTATFSSIAQPLGQAIKSVIVKTNTSNSMRHALVFKGQITKKPT